MSFFKTAEQLRDLFEGKEAIYVEKGAAHVKVSSIRWTLDGLIEAEAEEIPTAGFPWPHYPGSSPRRWTFGTGDMTGFSQHTWHGGYGGWSLYFAPDTVNGILNLVSQFPQELSFKQRYRQILDYLL